ncbi:hypothetical protein HDU76_000254, partial [Blyttiomyces sp. JEL0837]
MSTLYNFSQIVVPGNCYSSNYSIGIPIVDYGYSCAPHFYCPNSTASNPKSLPQVCPPTFECQAIRLASESCSPQGIYEPEICPRVLLDTGVSKKLAPEEPVLQSLPDVPSIPPPTADPTIKKGYGALPLSKQDSNHILKSANADPEKGEFGSDNQRGGGGGLAPGGGGTRSRRASILPTAPLGITDAQNLKRTTMLTSQTGLFSQLKSMAEEEERDTAYTSGVSISDIEYNIQQRPMSKKGPRAKSPELEGSAADLAGVTRAFARALNNRDDIRIDFRFENLGLALKDGKT